MQKNKTYSLIHLAGLTAGFTVALLIVTYIRFEFSYDYFHPKADRLYRITNTTSFGRAYALTPPVLASHLKDYFAGVEEVGRMYERSVTVKRPQTAQSFEEPFVFFADSSITKMFKLTWVSGDAKQALQEKFTIVINEEMARKYFGNESPIGETLQLGTQNFRISAIAKNFPRQSHLHFNMLVPYENMYDLETPANAAAMRQNLETNFVTTHSYTYVLLKPGAAAATIDTGFDKFIRQYAPPERQVGQHFSLLKVQDIHLRSTLAGESEVPNSVGNLIVFGAIGLLTLLMACINYVNLATAQSLTRVKEISMRKIFGSHRHQTMMQFFSESFLFCLASFFLALAAVYGCLPLMNDLTGLRLRFQDVIDPVVLLSGLGLLTVVTLLAGGYPAYFVTRFKSVSEIKTGASGSKWLRSGLVIVQLAVALMLLTCSLIIVDQLSFLLKQPLGFQQQQIISVPLFSDNMNTMYGRVDSSFHSRLEAFRNSLSLQPQIKATTLSSDVPGVGGTVYRSIIPEGQSKDERLMLSSMSVDFDFAQAYDLQLVAGRSFDRSFSTDASEAFIINETALREFGWPSAASAIGKTIYREYDSKSGRVVGVVKDFHFDVLTTPVAGLVLDVNPDQWTVLSIRFETAMATDLLAAIENQWVSLFPEKSFQYSFLDEQLAREYESFGRFGIMLRWLTALAVAIAALGVYGLVLFTVQRKVKEIGIRKVLGASTLGILQIIFRDFATLVLAALAVAAPVAYWAGISWMQQFAYRAPLGPSPLVASGVIILAVVGLTIGVQAWRAATANPTHSLRSD